MWAKIKTGRLPPECDVGGLHYRHGDVWVLPAAPYLWHKLYCQLLASR